MTLYVALRMALQDDSADPRVTLGAFYRAQTMKLLLGAGLIFIAVYILRDGAAALVTTLAATLAAYWFALLGDID